MKPVKLSYILPIFICIALIFGAITFYYGYQVGWNIVKDYYDPIIENKEYCEYNFVEPQTYEQKWGIENVNWTKYDGLFS